MAVGHLVELGHRRIAFIGGAERPDHSRVREEGYREAMRAEGLTIPDGYLEHGHWDWPATEAAAGRLMKLSPRPTAILCANDAVAMIATRTARRMGLRVPEDLSVVGFLNMRAAEWADPPLTTVAAPHVEIGRRAMQLLLADVKPDKRKRPSGQERSQQMLLPTELIVRQSTGPCATRTARPG